MRTRDIDARRQPGYFPYYKVQWWDPVTVAWRDIQRRFPIPEDAVKHGQRQYPKSQLRVMVISQTGRRVYPFRIR